MWLLSLFSLPSLLTSLIPSVLGFAGWFLKEIWEGLKDIFDNLSTILTVAVFLSLATVYGYSHKECISAVHGQLSPGKIWLDPFKPDG